MVFFFFLFEIFSKNIGGGECCHEARGPTKSSLEDALAAQEFSEGCAVERADAFYWWLQCSLCSPIGFLPALWGGRRLHPKRTALRAFAATVLGPKYWSIQTLQCPIPQPRLLSLPPGACWDTLASKCHQRVFRCGFGTVIVRTRCQPYARPWASCHLLKMNSNQRNRMQLSAPPASPEILA